MGFAKKLLVAECGGASARSFLLMFAASGMEKDGYSLVLDDKDPKQVDLVEKVTGHGKGLSNWLAPCAEYPDKYDGFVVGFGSGFHLTPVHAVAAMHDKTRTLRALQSLRCDDVIIPRIFDSPVVVRGRRSAGSSDVHVFTDKCVSEYFNPECEAVVDFNQSTGTYYPRLVHKMKAGHDVIVELLPTTSDMGLRLSQASKSIVEAMDYTGIGNVQFIIHNGVPVFVEFACRLSGSSRVVLRHKGNVLTGHPVQIASSVFVDMRS